MKKIKSSNTLPERMLRKAISIRGFRYRLHSKSLPGKPDIVFHKRKLVVFIDGEFWHGYKWKKKRPRIKSNRKYWVEKIERNIVRDRKNNRELKELGFTVIRFWEHQIRKNADACVERIIAHF
jgi:DNA mismatch endonuclease (patch repair protein)